RPDDPPHPGAQDAAALRADLQEAPREPRGVRHRQGPLRRHPALLDHGGPRAERLSAPVSGHPGSEPAPQPPLQNRVAIVTGGTGALGQAVTLRFLTEGAIVAVPYAVEAEAVHLRERVAPVGRDRLVTEPVDV